MGGKDEPGVDLKMKNPVDLKIQKPVRKTPYGELIVLFETTTIRVCSFFSLTFAKTFSRVRWINMNPSYGIFILSDQEIKKAKETLLRLGYI